MSAFVKKDKLTFVVALVRVYQLLLAPFWFSKCRFYPTCSNYCIEALQKKGFMKGIWLTVTRILRCNPVFPGGYDPVR